MTLGTRVTSVDPLWRRGLTTDGNLAHSWPLHPMLYTREQLPERSIHI